MKKNLKRMLSLIVAVTLIIGTMAFIGCGKGDSSQSSGGSKIDDEPTLTRIAITTKPTKLDYTLGETFDPTGMVVTAYYSDGLEEPITDYTYDKTGELKTSDRSVTVTYKGKIAACAINVTIPLETKLTLTAEETKVYVIEAESLNYDYCVNSNDSSKKPGTETVDTASGFISVGSLGVTGNQFGFAIQSEFAGKVTIVMRASAVSIDQDLASGMSFYFNGAIFTEHVLAWKGEGLWWEWEDVYFADLDLKEGLNKWICTMQGSNINLDCFYLIVNPSGDEELRPSVDVDAGEMPEYETKLTVETADKASYTVEAESLDYSKCVSSNDLNGQPNHETPAKPTSGDTCVSSLGVTGNRFGFKVESSVETSLSITFVVSSGVPGDQVLDSIMKIYWNESLLTTNYTVKWVQDNWHDWKNVTASGLTLKEGANYLDIIVLSGCPNIDCFILNVNPDAIEHTCENACSVCGGCTNENCQESACATKCSCVVCNLTVENANNKIYLIEAESLDYSKCVSSNNPNGQPNNENPATTTSGNTCKSSLGVAGNEFGFSVNSKVEASLSIALRVSNGIPSDQILDDIMEIYWNEVKLTTGYTLTWIDNNWHDWKNVVLSGLTLKEGVNQFTIKVISGCPNVDCFYVVVTPNGSEITDNSLINTTYELPAYDKKLTVSSSESNSYKVEAESLDYSNCKNSNNPEIQPNWESSDGASSGFSIGGLSVVGNRFGFTVESTVEATCDLVISLSSGTGSEQVVDNCIKIYWNGKLLTTNHTVSWNGNWHQWENLTVEGLSLKEGNNVLDIIVVGACPNMDCFTFVIGSQE